jgi:hypothetical protein
VIKGRELLKEIGPKINIDEFNENEDEGTYLEKTYEKVEQF